ncbi:MAG TPA: hypothetical protein VMM18_18325 [Gemmatimonadaceae bacterium]|nr:hypothetical protein [Gemmatimonadaceae bacterium]
MRLVRVILVLLVLLPVAPIDAQVITLPRRTTQPAGWTSFHIGFHESQGVNDGRTGTIWDFGSGLLYRASIEQARPGESSIGLIGSYARLPMSHRGDPACLISACNAHGDVWSVLANFRLGGGEGFHQILEFGLGITHYRNFTDDDTGARLAPLDGDSDVTLGVSYGFGYGLSRRTQIMLVQDFATSLHQGDGLQGGERRLVQQRTTRIGVRYGLGNRAAF